MNNVKTYHLRKETELVSIKKGVKKTQKHSIPYATVALTINPDGTVNRGVAILSSKDANKFQKSTGTAIAKSRLESAIKNNQNIHEIRGCNKSAVVQNGITFKYAGSVNDAPTDYEKKVFERDFAK